MWKPVLRSLARSPGWTLIVVLTLALGTGATTAIFSVVDAALLRPLPYPDADRLVALDDTRKPGHLSAFSYPDFADLQRESRTIPKMTAYTPGELILTGRGDARRLLATVSTPGLFDTLGVRPALGRALAARDDRPGAPRVAVVSDAFWRKQLGGGGDVLGQTLVLDGVPHTIVGVAPRGFQFPLQGPASDVYMPFPASDAEIRQSRTSHYLRAIGRLAPGRTVEQARAELMTIHKQLEAAYPDAVTGRFFTVAPLHESMVKHVRAALLILLAAVGFVLLIACANVANLLLARAAGRQRELAIRSALGASRRRIVAEQLIDSAVLSLLGAAGGAVLAMWGVDWLRAAIPPEIGAIRPIAIDGRVLAFTLAIALATGLLSGAIPGWAASRARAGDALQAALARGGVRHARARGALVVAEMGLALLLLVGAALTVQTFVRLSRSHPGFDPAGLEVADIGLPDSRYGEPQAQVAFYRRLEEKLAAIPGAAGVAVAAPVPLNGNYSLAFSVSVVGRPPEPRGHERAAQFFAVSPGYHRTMGIPLVAGRLFTPADDAPGAPKVILVSEGLARRVFPGEDPIGKKLRIGYQNKVERTIVGVVGSVKADALDRDAHSAMYTPFSQTPLSFLFVVARSRGPQLAGPLRAAVADVDAGVPVDVTTMDALMRASLARRHLSTLLLGLFSAVALLLAVIGLYGVVSYTVTQRSHEMSVRLALGARPAQVTRLVVAHGLRLALLGVALGIALALALARVLAVLLYGVRPVDLPTFIAVAAVLLAATVAASYLPARRASRLDPMRALRAE